MIAVDDRLCRAWENRNLIPFVGAGVAMGAAGLPGWKGLLEKGRDFVKDRLGATPDGKKTVPLLNQHLKATELLTGFSVLRNLLTRPGGGPSGYATFLDSVLDKPRVTDPSVLDALRRLDPRVVVTTNLDTLLSDHRVVRNPTLATWRQPATMLDVLRGGRGVIHLHGVYTDPDSVVLSEAEYTRINLTPDDVKAVTRTLFYGGVLLFIGCSVDGVTDPHLRPFLAQFAELSKTVPGEVFPHFLLHRGELKPEERVLLRDARVMPISFGSDFADLPKYLAAIPTADPVTAVKGVRDRIACIRTAESAADVLSDARTFLERQVFPGRTIRVAFARKTDADGRTVLRPGGLVPPGATRNEFSYPQTLAAWALIEGRIFDWRFHRDPPLLGKCDFDRLKTLGKLAAVKALLLATDPADPVLSDFLKPDEIKAKTEAGTLELTDLYQNWVGRQTRPHYVQFVSLPVPVIDRLQNRPSSGWPEYGVFNIDTLDTEPLLTPDTAPLLELVSHMTALGFEHLTQKGCL